MPAARACAGAPEPDAGNGYPRDLAVLPREAAWVSFGVLGGSTLLDSHLADYDWNTQPRADWGAAARVGRGRLSAGLRLERWGTAQAIDLPSGVVSAAVHGTSLELTGRARVAHAGPLALIACASAGRLRLSWAPSRIDVSPGVTADLPAIDEWIGGAGLAAQLPLPARWLADVELDRQVFRLDTAHRSGAAIVNQRESFGDWGLRLELARQISFTSKGNSR
jgi:hypothetical protein